MANLLALRTAELAKQLRSSGKAFIIENPEHWDMSAPSLWLLSEFVELARMPGVSFVHGDQCRFGGMAKKPTSYLHYNVDLQRLQVRCNHPRVEWMRADGTKYLSPHEQTVQRKVGDQWATKALAAYPSELNLELARALAAAPPS